MLTKEEFEKAKSRKKRCPYGRERKVGSVECENCAFHRLESYGDYKIREARCDGDEESVREHSERWERIIACMEQEEENN
ncbi:MAG: hypothetical protein IJ684_02885 [Bacteroidales bacterium]|nr:hypothetical protein [Bacteroidales bacterium]